MGRAATEMAATDYLSFAFAGIVACGGIIGFIKAGSTVSLGMGLAFGGIAAFGAMQTSKDPKNVWIILFTSLILAGVMGSRFVKSGKFMPAGLVATLSLLQAARMGYRIMF